MSDSANPLVVTVLFGGRSAEHDISLQSARTVVSHLDPTRFEVHLVGIDRQGGWLSEEASQQMLETGQASGSRRGPYLPESTQVVFPVLHGPGGEDGTLQGWLQLLDVPFVGSDCTGSAVAMDKTIARHILRSANVPVLLWTDLRQRDWLADRDAVLDQVEAERGYPCFVKPARLGSSVGISRVSDREELTQALDLAFRYGEFALVEPALDCRELEIAVLDGDPEIVSLPGEIVSEGWYDYDTKYRDESAELLVPTENIEPRMAAALQEFALKAFRVLRMSGMARVDFMIDRKLGRYYLNEVNAIPGFTSISMYAKLMETAGVPFAALVERLIELAMAGRRASSTETVAPAERELEA